MKTKLLLHAVLLAALVGSAPGADHTSTWNGTSGNWTDTTKWSTPTAPGTFPNNGSPSPTYDAIQNGGTISVNVPITIEKFNLGRGTLNAANDITFNGRLTLISPGDLGGSNTLTGVGVVNANGGLTWTDNLDGFVHGSNIQGTNTAVINGRTLATDVINVTGVSNIVGTGGKILDRRAMNNGDGVNLSTTNWTAGTFGFSNSAVFTNKAAAIFDNALDGLFENRGGTNYFINEGTFTKSAGTGTTTVNVVFDNSGTVNVNSGTLSLNVGGIHSGMFQIASGKTLNFGGGTHRFDTGAAFSGDGTVSVGGATLTSPAGTIIARPLALNAPAPGTSSAVVTQVFNGAGIWNITGPLTWNAINQSNSFAISEFVGVNTAVVDGRTQATDEVNITGGMTLTGGGFKSVKKRALNHGDGVNPSVANWTAGGLELTDAAVFTNKAGSSFIAQFDGLIDNRSGTRSTFINEGTFIKSSSAGTLNVGSTNVGATNNVLFINTGAVQINSGTLSLRAGGSSHMGSVEIASGGTLKFETGSHTLNSGTSFSGAGSVAIDSGTVTANANVTIVNPLTLKAPPSVNGSHTTMTLTGLGMIEVTAPMVWSAQTDGAEQIGMSKILGVNTSVANGRTLATDVINITGGLTINGPGTKYLDRRALNHGDGVNPSLASWTQGTVVIASNAVFTNKSGATFTTNFDGKLDRDPVDTGLPPGTFINEGIFTKNGGSGTTQLHTSIAFFNSGTVNASSGNIAFDGGYTQTAGALVLNGGSVSRGSTGLAIQGGKVQGGGTITGGVTSSGGTIIIEPGIGTTPGALTINGDLTLTSGSKLSFDIGGTAAGTEHDKITETAGSTTSVAGVVLEVSLLGSYIPAPGDQFVVFDAATTAITNSFANVANGSRIATTDGKGTFKVNYGPSTAILPVASNVDKVILSDFQTTPTSLTLDDNQIVENAPLGTVVGLLGAADPNPAATFTFSLTDTANFPDNNQFQISGNQLQAKAGLDFETKNSYSIRLRVTNNSGGFLDQTFTILVQDVPSPSSLALSISSISENLPINTVIGTLSATDPTPEATFTFALVDDTVNFPENARFNISGTSLRSSEVFDFETNPGPFSIRVRVTNNGGETLEQVLSITLVNEGVTDFALSPGSVQENLPAGTSVGTLSATVTPLGTAVTYALVSGTGSTDNALFTVNGSTIQTAAVLDFEAAATRSIRVKATDANGETFEKAVVVTVTDVPSPTALALSASSIAENQPINTVIGTLSATDPDPEATFTFALVSGEDDTDNARFNINGTSLRSSEVFDFEMTPGPFSIRVRVTNNGGETREQVFSITLEDQGPTALALSPSSVLEGKANTAVGDLSVTTIVPAGTAISTWELVAGAADNALFTLTDTTIKTGATALDFETAATRTVRVKATDANGESFVQDLTVTVTDVAITDITLSATTVLENLPAGTVIADLGAVLSPADPGATPAFSIVSATPNDALTISGTQLVTSRPIRRSVTPSIAVRLRADFAGESIEEDATITVNANATALRFEKPAGNVITGLFVGEADVGGLAANTTFVVTNAGPGHAFNVRFTNPVDPNNEFVVTAVPPVPDNDLAPGESVTFNIDFRPVAYENRSASVVFTSDNAAGTTLAVQGRAVGAEISVQQPLGTDLVDGAALDFGGQLIGLSGQTKTFIVKNVGFELAPNLKPLTPLSASITGPDAAFFVLDTQGFGPPVAVGASSSFRVTFQPEGQRSYNATLTITSNDLDEGSFDIPLIGEGLSPLLYAQTAYVKASDTATRDDFGTAVAVSGNTVVVGAPSERGPGPAGAELSGSGSVYVFVRDMVTGAWSQQAKLRASNPGIADKFGWSVAVSGDTVVVGAIGEDSSTTGVNSTPDELASGAGAAYVFVRSAGVWSQQAYLKASQVTAVDQFGWSVAVSGDTVVVGAIGEDSSTTGVNSTPDELASGAGAAYVFVRSAGVWSQQAYLKASQVTAADQFGYSVAVSGDTVVVGANQEDSSTTGINSSPDEVATNSGAAYVFVRSGTAWSQQAYLKAHQVTASDRFGVSVAASGDTVVVGATGEDSTTTGIDSAPNELGFSCGATYVFVRSGTVWSQQAYLKASQVTDGDQFGVSVAVSGDTVVVGAWGEDSSTTGINSTPDEVAANSGAAYVFVRSGTAWSQQAYLKASQVTAADFFGEPVAVSEDTVVVGADLEDSSTTGINNTANESAFDSGAAYIFEMMPPEVLVHAGDTTGSPRLVDNQGEAVDFGMTPLGISVTRSFTINNVRAVPLSVSSITAPEGLFEVVNAPTASIPAQGSAVFSVRLKSLTLGINSGNITINSDDSSNPEFVFPVTGEVLALPPGSLDPRFGVGGVVMIDFIDNVAAAADDMLMLPDGRLVVAGTAYSFSTGFRFALARLMPDGALDSGFGEGGTVVTGVPAFKIGELRGICLQGDKIVAVGTSPLSDSNFLSPELPGYALARYLPDGTLDSSFATNGFFIDNTTTESESPGRIVALSSQKLLVSGTQFVNSTIGFRPYVQRFDQNGRPDNGFGSSNGTVILPGGSYGGAVAVNAAGDIYAAGSSSATVSSSGRLRVWKISATTSGITSLTFPQVAPAGYPVQNVGEDGEYATELALQADGKPVIAAKRVFPERTSPGGLGFITARATPELIPDPQFNGTGTIIEHLDPETDPLFFDERANSVAVQKDGKIVVAGSADYHFVVVRYTPAGELDTSFGTGGKVILTGLGVQSSAAKVLLDAAGDIYVAGRADGTNQHFVVVKLFGGIDPQPAIALRNGSTTSSPVITNGQATPISFGEPRVGGSTVSKSFLVENPGSAPLNLNQVQVPAGFLFSTGGSVASVPAGSNGLIRIVLPTSTLGTFSGPVRIFTNDPVQGTFTFPITGSVVPNAPPVFDGFVAKINQGEIATITLTKLISKVSDANGDPVSVTALAQTSLFGANITFDGIETLKYIPPATFFGTDQFSVNFSDSDSEIVGVVSVEVAQDPAFNPKNAPKLEPQAGGLAVSFVGVPGKTYKIQRSTNLVDWTIIGNATASATGKVSFTDPSPPQPSAFYRITF